MELYKNLKCIYLLFLCVVVFPMAIKLSKLIALIKILFFKYIKRISDLF